MITFPNAKINIGLNVVSRRPDGFRNLASCFYPVSWCDALEILPAPAVTFSLSGIPVPGAADTNLCLKAYELLRKDFDLPPVSLHLHKNIPIGAGLGGGSADAAFTLQNLNDQFKLGIPADSLENYARQLGSDCAFFVRNQPVFARERGDVFEPIKLNLTGYQALLVYPNLPITTAEAYGRVAVRQPETSLRDLLQQDILTWKKQVRNDFEDALFPLYPVLGQLKEKLYEMGAVYAAMTGSGSTVFGIFPPSQAINPDFPAPYRVWQGVL